MIIEQPQALKNKEANMKEKIEALEAFARGYMMIAKALKEDGIESWRSYTKQGVKCCQMAIEMKKQYEQDRTDIIEIRHLRLVI